MEKGAIKLIDSGEFIFEGGRQTRSGLPLFEGIVSIPPEQQIDLAVILRRKGEREYLRVGNVDFAFYFKESGRCNLVVKDYGAGRASVFPLSQLEQEEFRRMILYSLYGQTVSLYLEGNVITKESDSTEVEINGVFFSEEECFRLSKAMELGSYYESWVNGTRQVVASIMGYSISNYVLSSESSYKLQAVFESASLFFKPSFLFFEIGNRRR